MIDVLSPTFSVFGAEYMPADARVNLAAQESPIDAIGKFEPVICKREENAPTSRHQRVEIVQPLKMYRKNR